MDFLNEIFEIIKIVKIYLTINSQKMMYNTSQKTSVHPRAFAGLYSCSSLLSSGELQQLLILIDVSMG